MADKSASQKSQKKVYQKPTWVKDALVERFALACNKKTPAACPTGNKLT